MDLSSYNIGDEIYCDLSDCRCGGFAEYVCVPENQLFKKPSNISHHDAAALLHTGILALQGLVEKEQPKPVVDGHYDFDNIPELIPFFVEGKQLGKVVVEIET